MPYLHSACLAADCSHAHLDCRLESVIGNMIKRVLRLVRDAYDQYVETADRMAGGWKGRLVVTVVVVRLWMLL